MQRRNLIILVVALVLGAIFVVYSGYLGDTGDEGLSGQDQTQRDVPVNEPDLRAPDARPTTNP
jgi:hypothetical protein